MTYVDGQVTFAISPLIRGISLARKILLADDSVTAQNMGRKILADAGYEVIAVNNGSAALKKIAELKPDLVILDVYMPGYSGLEVCQRLKESQETARIPVLLPWASSSLSSRKRRSGCGPKVLSSSPLKPASC